MQQKFILDLLETDQDTFNKYFQDKKLNLNVSEQQKKAGANFAINDAVSVVKEEVKLVEKVSVYAKKEKINKRKGFFTRLFGKFFF